MRSKYVLAISIAIIGIWRNSTVFWNYVIDKEPGFPNAREEFELGLKIQPYNYSAQQILNSIDSM